MNNYSTSLKFGVMGGLILIICCMLFYFIDAALLVSYWTLPVYFILIFLMIYGGITDRNEKGGTPSIIKAFVSVFIISITATLVYDTFVVILVKFIDPKLPEIFKAKTIEMMTSMMERMNAPDDKIEEALKRVKAQNFGVTTQFLIKRYTTSAIIGLVFSFIIALFIGRPNKEENNNRL